jgi:uncharacterized membrane protein
MNKRLLIIVLLVGLLSACGSQPAETPASQPTEEIAPVMETAPPSTPVPSTPTVPPTEESAEEPTAETSGTATVSFANDVLPIVRSRCSACHGGSQGTEEGLELTNYENIMAGSDNGPVVIAGDADNSLLVELIVEQEMPKRGPKLTPPQVQLIIDWVNEGAMNN